MEVVMNGRENGQEMKGKNEGLGFVSDRTLVTRGSRRGMFTSLHLEEVRDYLLKLTKLQDPVDYERTLNHLHVDFSKSPVEAFWLNPNGRDAETLRLSENGATQLAVDVLPPRFFGGLRELARMDVQGGKLATMTWAKFAGRQDETPRRVRTVLMNLNGHGVQRVIRSCHSQGYAPYSNLEFVQDILDHAADFANLPVLHFQVTDSAMRLRLAGVKNEEEIEVKKPITMIEAWNSEVGRRRVGLRGGMYKLICTNGAGHWDEKTEYNWIHRGDAERIRAGVRNAFENILTAASGVVEAYEAALGISIDNAFAWMEAELSGRVSDRVVNAAKVAMTDPTTTPGGLLASVIDAVTLVAQNEVDLFEQYEVERVAAGILQKGRAIALKHGGRIPVPVA